MSIAPAAAARLLGGEVRGDRVLCPGPGHSPVDRSLSVIFGSELPEGFAVHSFAGDDPIGCRDYVKERLGFRSGFAPAALYVPHASPAAAGERLLADTADERTRGALRLWNLARRARGTLAETYLRRRGVWDLLPPDADGQALRWHPDGYMVALVRSIVMDAPQAIHRTFLDGEGQKLDRRALGPLSSGAIKLSADADVSLGLAIGEGLETVLSLRGLAGYGATPVWSLISTAGVKAFPVLPGIEALTIAVDADPAGRTAAEDVTRRWIESGREVVTIEPARDGADLNGEARHVA